MIIPVCVVTSTEPKRLTKQYHLRNGKVHKSNGGVLVQGRAEIREIDGLMGFGEFLPTLGPDQALTYGLPKTATIALTTQEKWDREGRPEGVIPRSADMFSWNAGSGIMMFDHDPQPDGPQFDKDELVAALRSAVPGLRNVAMLWYPSASSFIVNDETREEISGLKGQRLYIAVADARDIPRAAKAIIEALWASGYGHFQISKSGSLLPRTLIDGSVWQTNRLDFAAGASCRAPLRQKRGNPVLVPGAVELIDTASAIPDPTPEVKAESEAARAAARKDMAAEAASVREAWIEDRADEMVGPNADESARAIARTIASRAAENGTLSGDFIINVKEDGKFRAVTVCEVLDEPLRYNGLLTLDPLEPDYDGQRTVGKLYTIGARPNLFSFAHGDRNFRLLRQPTRIELVKGRTHDAVSDTLQIMRRAPDLFDFGGALVMVVQGNIHPLDEASLIHLLGGITQFWRSHKVPNAGYVEVLEDPPPRVAKQILSLGARRELKPLRAVVTAPTLRPDGTVLDVRGYDEPTGILYETTEDIAPVPSAPDRATVETALDQLMLPFRDFPCVGSNDWGILLAALLTATVRSALPTAPGFGLDAPVQGSGKTLIANCIGTLATGAAPTVWPHTFGRDDEEVRKRLFAALRHGASVLVWDNVVGTFDSAAMAAALTSEMYTDRVLGKSESISVPNRILLLMTGNNLTLTGDMARRVLVCRIDPQTDLPFAREFDLDPLTYTLEHRSEMVVAALTIIRGWLTSDAARAPGRMASFELWDDFVRQAVAWLGRDIRPGAFSDPMQAVVAAQAGDPEQETLGDMLRAWRELFGDEYLSSGKVVEKIRPSGYGGSSNDDPAEILGACLREYSERAAFSSKSLGRVLKYRLGRIVGGLRLEKVEDTHTKTCRWRVAEVD